MKDSAPPGDRGSRRLVRGLALAGAALAVPAVAHALIQRRLRAPKAPGWGRTHRYSGHFGPVVFQEIGAGPPVVLLHAFGPGFDSCQWRAAAEALAPRFRVLAPDLPGWGRSAPLEPRPRAYLACLADFLAGVVWGRAALVAAGHAAPYAIHLAEERSALVRGLALVAPLGLPTAGGDRDEDPARDAEAAPDTAAAETEATAATGAPAAAEPEAPAATEPEVPATATPPANLDSADGPGPPLHPLVGQLMAVPLLRVSVLDALTSRAVLGSYLRNHAYAAGDRVDAALLEHHYRVSHLPAHRQALAAYWRGDLDVPAGAALRALQVPLWIGLGGEDRENWPSADVLPAGAQVEAFEGTRALPHAEKPVTFGKALARFLDQLPPA
ncbi:MAG TPA: alpha/beta hydrolase [Thermoanaerobaculia bacterium]|jgi:pimeloyl-ACP methyl ester carboxylesterase|nr:alpha/beta hydrolase [Thermoanaerobaculia bacterium]